MEKLKNNKVMPYINTFEFEIDKEGVLLCTTVGARAMSIKHIKGRFNLSQNCMIIVRKDNSY